MKALKLRLPAKTSLRPLDSLSRTTLPALICGPGAFARAVRVKLEAALGRLTVLDARVLPSTAPLTAWSGAEGHLLVLLPVKPSPQFLRALGLAAAKCREGGRQAGKLIGATLLPEPPAELRQIFPLRFEPADL
ncbi:MAG: hypothetical protein IPJ65_07325 [Archangiaceae bacterium]|nr:hypothetical protein [Archangiaceae bacterium]